MSASQKYPRSSHFPFSPGMSNDDRMMPDINTLLNRELIASEKLDGSNCCLERDGVFARSHSGPPTHPSFNMLKAMHADLRDQLEPNLQFFGEYCYAVHSITYGALPAYFFLFGIRDKLTQMWWDFDSVVAAAEVLDLQMPPVIWRGSFVTRASLERAVMNSATMPSTFGGPREGLVVRWTDGFLDEEFNGSLAKWVRQGHVQTDAHWTSQEIVRQRLTSQ